MEFIIIIFYFSYINNARVRLHYAIEFILRSGDREVGTLNKPAVVGRVYADIRRTPMTMKLQNAYREEKQRTRGYTNFRLGLNYNITLYTSRYLIILMYFF